MKLVKIKKLEGTITLRSGLHIGSGDMEMHIGGTDSPVIKHPHTQEPYIPGSSLKGKVRSLLEMESGLMIHTRGGVVSNSVLQRDVVENDPVMKHKGEAILKIFGSSGADNEDSERIGPTRVSFADCYLDDTYRRQVEENRWSLTEEKSENMIDRIKGTAANPRFIERVTEGTVFRLLITFKVLQNGDDELFNDTLLMGLKLLEMDAIGGSGSRGYGRIALDFDDQEIDDRFSTINPFQQETGR